MRRFRVVVALLALAALGGCSIFRKSCDVYEIELRVDRNSKYAEAAIGVYVLLCDDDHPVPDLASKEAIEGWFESDPGDLKAKLREKSGIQFVNVVPGTAGSAPRAVLQGRELVGKGSVFLVANFASADNVTEHTRAIDLDTYSGICAFTVDVRPGVLEIVPPDEAGKE